jgi:hypothetical protein
LLLNTGMMRQMNDLQLKKKCFLPKILFVFDSLFIVNFS